MPGRRFVILEVGRHWYDYGASPTLEGAEVAAMFEILALYQRLAS